MRPIHRFATPAVLCLLALGPGAGCDLEPSLFDTAHDPQRLGVLRVQLEAFDESRPEGIRLWRRTEAGDGFEFVSEIRLGASTSEAGAEYIGYRLLDPDGQDFGLPLSSLVQRDGEAVTLALWLVRFGPEGEFKASVYNEAGESELSSNSVVL
jgi:hypothetical protein